MQANPDERLIYLTDVTEWRHLEQTYRDEQIVFGILHLNNLQDVTQEMDDQSFNTFADERHGGDHRAGERPRHFTAALRRQVFYDFSSQDVGSAGRNRNFDILDTVREMTKENKIPITLSIGIGSYTGTSSNAPGWRKVASTWRSDAAETRQRSKRETG